MSTKVSTPNESWTTRPTLAERGTGEQAGGAGLEPLLLGQLGRARGPKVGAEGIADVAQQQREDVDLRQGADPTTGLEPARPACPSVSTSMSTNGSMRFRLANPMVPWFRWYRLPSKNAVPRLEGKIEGRRSQGEAAGATFLDRVRAQARAGYASAAKCDACGTIQYPEPGGRCPGCGEPMRGDPGASLQAKVRRAVEGIGCR